MDDFPEHIKSLVQKEKESEEQEKRQREIERNTCKVPGPLAWSGSSALHENKEQLIHCLLFSIF